MITLAWLPLTASVTLSSLLTVALGTLAFRKSAEFVVLTLVAVVMIWRGEAWKAVFLQSERQLSELRRQLQRPISPNTPLSDRRSAYPGQLLGYSYQAPSPRYAGSQRVPPCDAILLPDEAEPADLRTYSEYCRLSASHLPGIERERRGIPQVAQLSETEAALALLPQSLCKSPASPWGGSVAKGPSLEKPYSSWPNTSLPDILIGLGLVVLLVIGFGTGWASRGNYEERRTATPAITLFKRPQTKQDDSKL